MKSPVINKEFEIQVLKKAIGTYYKIIDNLEDDSFFSSKTNSKIVKYQNKIEETKKLIAYLQNG